MKKYLKLMRIKHYIKNGLIFVPLIFSRQLLQTNMLLNVILGFISFSLIASVVYIINDINDVEKDRKHPKKCKRPIASGDVSVRNAWILAIILSIISFTINYAIAGFSISVLVLLAYLTLNILYSLGLKNIPIVDITILMLGFFLRVLYGAAIVNIHISNWLYLTVISMSFYLGIGKRREEFAKQGKDTRKVLEKYSYEFLDKNMYMSLVLTIIFYSLWTIDQVTIKSLGQNLIWTVPLVIVICMKYSLNVETDKDGAGDPVEVVFADKILLSLISLFILTMICMIYIF